MGSRILMSALEPGRICIAGSFGRAWVGTITYQEAIRSFDYEVFFHARRQPEQQNREDWKHVDLAFLPLFMKTLTAPPATPDARPTVRVLLGRDGGHAFNRYHPLAIDVEAQTVDVVQDAIRVVSQPYSIFDDGQFLYWVDSDESGNNLFKLGPADLRRHIVGTPRFRGSIAKTHQGYVIDSTASRQRNILSFSNTLAGPYAERELKTEAVMQMFYSRFHGLVLMDRRDASLFELHLETSPEAR
jgi:hypothetical protein